MKVLRHEEFVEGCKAACNGPYDGKWSKTMIGYGPEDDHFVLELTYNYGIGSYCHGNDFIGIHIHCSEIYRRIACDSTLPKVKHEEFLEVIDPAGYRFFIHNEKAGLQDPVRKLELASSDIRRSIDYWSKMCGMKLLESSDDNALFTYKEGQCQLQLTLSKHPIDRGQAYGRVAFSCPRNQLALLQETMDKEKETILTRLVSLDTPGKATVEVVILADPDGHEICFVGDEAFRSLSQVDPKADELLASAMAEDHSDSWFQKRGGKKAQPEQIVMVNEILPWPAPTSLVGFLLGIISLFVIDFILLIYTRFFSIPSLILLFASFVSLLFLISHAILPRTVEFFSPYATRGRDLDPKGYRPNLVIAFCLGGVFLFGLILSFHAFEELSNSRIVWPFGVYLSLLAFFHWSEFFVAALTNPSRTGVDLYLLDHSPEYLGAMALSFIEYWSEVLFWPSKTTSYLWLNLTGLLICVAGEAFRKMAMWTAADNFSHYIEHTWRREHRLVRKGVYALCRHPAYVGWFFWSLGTQLLLVNPLCSFIYPLAAYLFFRNRVYFEERSLVAFFGDAYRSYQHEVPTGLPFIRGYVELTVRASTR
ncbi:unnamed protein product [Hydatigera taeniaeformis]|uniref:Protein-S-isoprenylcysteine O-methyltransferase n=1 Tax=Hydatigena taeniaeformis TaxID=6205 RepID=A0A0R3X165_HYDTA|nr:unnamed protein product [Hydatigera taeniaeformis]